MLFGPTFEKRLRSCILLGSENHQWNVGEPSTCFNIPSFQPPLSTISREAEEIGQIICSK